MTQSTLVSADPGPGTALARRPESVVDVHPKPQTRGPMVAGIAAIVVFASGFGVWASVAPISRAAIAAGEVQAEGNTRTIQHLEGGIIRQILVKNGDKVAKDQVLMRLDDIASESNTAQLRAMHWSAMAEIARDKAELGGLPEIQFPAALEAAQKTDPYAVEAIQAQQTLFLARKASLESLVRVLALRADEASAQIDAANGQLQSVQRQIDLNSAESADIAALLQKGLETKAHYYDLQRTSAQLLGARNDALASKARAETLISEAKTQMIQAKDQYQQEASSELRKSNAQLIDAAEKLRVAEDVSKRRDIVAPTAGIVMNIRLFTIGAVVRPGDAVMDLQPINDTLVAEVKIQPHDVDVVHEGMTAQVRFPAFTNRATPYLEGTVTYVAPDATQDERTHETYYRAQVQISQTQLNRLPHDETVIAGMPVEAEIAAGHRTFFEYLLQPLRNSFARAFHES